MSTIRGVNLLPLHRRRSARRRARTRFWIIACAAWAGVLAAVYAPCAATKQREDAALEDGMTQTSQRVETATRSLTLLRATCSRARRTLSAARAIAEHPDWSILFDAVARVRGDGIVLERIEIAGAPAPSSAAGNAPGGPDSASGRSGGLVLDVEGVGESPSEVTEFTLSLERSALFDRVTLVETKQRTLRAVPRTSFKLQCAIEPGNPADGRTAP